MPPDLSPLRLQATARSLTRCIGSLLNEMATSDLEPEFNYRYEEPNNLHREIFTLLPLAVRTGQVTERSKRAVLKRVVLRDHDSLTRFFITIIKSPECAGYVEELHCHLDLGQHTSAGRLSHDITLLSSVAEHLDHCPISLDILISIRKHMVQEAQDQPYRADLDVRLRQAMFLSLLGHLRSLHTLRMTIHGPAHNALSWLCSELLDHYPAELANRLPCLYICPSLRKVSFHAAATHRPSPLSHAFALWPLIDLPEVEILEIDNNPAIWTGDTAIPDPDPSNGDDVHNEEQSQTIHESLNYLHTLHIKNYLPHPIALNKMFSSLQTLHTLCIYGSAIPTPLHTHNTNPVPAGVIVNFNTLLRLPTITRTLQHLSIDEAHPTPQSALSLFGPAGTLTGECLAGLGELRGLYIPAFALFGTAVGDGGKRGRVEIGGGTQAGEGGSIRHRGASLPGEGDGDDGEVVCLPPKLERLEVVEDPLAADGERGEGGTMGLMADLAAWCGEGLYPALNRVVLWCRGWEDGRCGWSREEQEVVEGMFSKVGVIFECRAYEPWPEGKVGGWRIVEETPGDISGKG